MAGDGCRARTTPHQQQPQHPLPLDARHRHSAPCSVHCDSPFPQRPSNYDGSTPPHSQSPPPATRLDPPVTGVSTTPLIAMDSKKGSGVGGGAVGGGVQGRRRSGSGGGAASGSTQQLRSPAVKRPTAAPVALQGWLHKQGSEGLMLWKKRWFVLSDYCLFYYKGPEEEKLLGSILLPSYKVAPCAPEDRVFRKFSFKAEHANMRTYYFAADSRELMVQWMNALSLASILQDGSSLEEHRSGRPSVSSISSLLNASVDDSDSGFHGYRPRSGASSSAAGALGSSSGKIEGQMPTTKTPLNSSHDSALSNGWMAQRLSPQQRSGDAFAFHQPLYANAPPKPRRMTSEPDDYGVTSPDRIPENRLLDTATNFQEEQLKPMAYEPPVAQPQESVSIGTRPVELRHHYHIPPTGGQYGAPALTAPASIERRTPDTYGRSNSTTPAPTYPQLLARATSDYEDVYNHTPAATTGSGSPSYLTHVYRRHSSQMTPLQAKGLPSQQLYGTVPKVQADGVPPVPPHGPQLAHVGQPAVSMTAHTTFRYPVQDGGGTCSRAPFYGTGTGMGSLATPIHHRVGRHPPRPHSADFLEYDTRHQQYAYQQHSLPHPHREHVFSAESYADTQRVTPLQRPKSSLDVMTREPATTDNYYWSEESYAQKMRQSASYVHQIPMTPLYRGQSTTSRTPASSKRTGNQSSISGLVGDSVSTQSASCSNVGTTNDEIGALRQNKVPDTSCRITDSHGIEGWTADARTSEHIVTSGRRVSSDPRIPTDSRIDPRTINDPRSPSRPHYQQLQQRRWSEYSDSRGSSHFMRSASARLPRARNQEDDYNLKFDDHRQRSKSDVRDGERKIQQREESMKRLLEWKQRMLQSPLTRKTSGSSVRGTAQNELSRYYKQQQQVLRELAGGEDADGSRRHRPLPEDSYTIPGPGRSALRSRSQDGRRSSASVNRYNSFSSDDEASGSGSVIGRDPLPSRAVSAVSIQQQQNTPQPRLSTRTIEDQALSTCPTKSSDPLHTKACSSGVADLNGLNKGLGTFDTCSTNALSNEDIPSFDSVLHESTSKDNSGSNEDQTKRGPGGEEARHLRLNVSAGELLGRTHEELVLLLIQLRRQSAGICKAMEICHMDIEAQARLADVEASQRLDHLRKLEELKKHLLDLEKQYEKGKPLVNLVDNMVKLGSLYRSSTGQLKTGLGDVQNSASVRERLEFNHKVQEQRLLAEERRDWKRLSPDHNQLQAKVQELYRLDRLLQEESGTLHTLQKNKELLEKALGGLRHKLEIARSNPTEAERYRKQQKLLERELSRIRMLLAHNSKKLEETVAENVRLEQELVVLRQKLQASRRAPQNLPRTSAFFLQDSSAVSCTSALETELLRVQQLVGDLQRQRQELSMQVRQLTEKSHSLVQQIRPGPTGVPGAGAIPGRKRHHSTWLETDLDSMVTLDRGLESPASPQHQPCPGNVALDSRAPLYINTNACSKEDEFCLQSTINEGENIPAPLPHEISPEYASPPPHPPLPSEEVMLNAGIDPDLQYCSQMDISEADDRIKRFYGIIPKEKQQEIKTVRIVKRESERRQRDRDRSGNIGIPLINGPGFPGKRTALHEEADTTSDKECPVSLLHGFGKEEGLLCQQQILIPPPPVRVPSPRNDSVTILRNLMMYKHRVRFESGSGRCSSSESTNSQGTNSPSSSHPLSAQLSMVSSGSSDASPQLSPIFKSEAARAIVMEMSSPGDSNSQLRKRAVPREKRRHHTVSSSRPMRDMETNLSQMGTTRSRDDLDMERVLRPRLNTPDVVRSTLSHKDFKYNEDTIDNILGVPNKIVIPERYVPEQLPELSAEEQLHRSKKAEAIRKMLSEITLTSTDVKESEPEEKTSTLKKKMAAEKKQREHILQLNQILAKQVMEKSKIVAVKALATLPLKTEMGFDEDDLSPIQPLPLFQQRENYFT